MSPQEQTPYDIIAPPAASYPTVYITAWVVLAAILALTLFIFIAKRRRLKRQLASMKSIRQILESEYHNDPNAFYVSLAILTRTARRHNLDSTAVTSAENLLFAPRLELISHDARAIATNLALQLKAKIT